MEEAKIRRQSVVPTVNVQIPTPILSADTEQTSSDEPMRLARNSSSENVSDNEDSQTNVADSEQMVKSVKFQDLPPESETSIKKEEEDPQKQSSEECDDKLVKQSSGEEIPTEPPMVDKPRPSLVSKTGIPGPPARRLSRIPQQLYIKTTPAIPMNANIQHILTNVARTEGPFEYPGEAVKAALIALHDNAW